MRIFTAPSFGKKTYSDIFLWTLSNVRSEKFSEIRLRALRNRDTCNVYGQISQNISLPNGGYCVYYPSNIFQSHALLTTRKYHQDGCDNWKGFYDHKIPNAINSTMCYIFVIRFTKGHLILHTDSSSPPCQTVVLNNNNNNIDFILTILKRPFKGFQTV